MASISGVSALAFSGNQLSPEEAAGLEVAIAKRCLEEDVEDVRFWGKITGKERDYLVAYAVIKAEGFPTKRFFACSTGTFDLQQLPELSDDFRARASAMKGKFKGDPTDLYGEEEEEEEEDDEDEDEDGAPKVAKPEKFSELHRLSFVVEQIDNDTAVVPRGAYIVSATHQILRNAAFTGLTRVEAGDLGNFFHFRRAAGLEAQSALQKEGLVKSTDFLDSVQDDSPAGTWVLRVDSGRAQATLRSLKWPGYYFSAGIKSADWAGAYFGDGQENHDLAFML